jgi:hypothetical protein
MSLRTIFSGSLAAAVLCFGAASVVLAADNAERKVELAEGKISLMAPEAWQKKQPRVRIIEYEFATPAVEGDADDGRVTIMGAGGEVQANIDRWLAQFNPAEGKTIKDSSKVRELEAGGQKVHLVDISGTYKDQPAGPFAGGKTVLRENYRMLGAIVQTDEGNYFIKYYGPKKTVDANEKGFNEMVNSLKVKK